MLDERCKRDKDAAAVDMVREQRDCRQYDGLASVSSISVEWKLGAARDIVSSCA